jgi:hypothetical protein
MGAGVLTTKGDLAVVGKDHSVVGVGDTVNAASEIVEDRTGTLDGWFAVNDPVLLPYGFRHLDIFESSANTVEEDTKKQHR